MQLPALVLAAASVSSGVLASNMNNELEGRFHQRADALLKPRQSNLQTFTGALGGITAHPVTQTSDTQRPFSVGNDTFTDFADAARRSCDMQKNSCADVANSGTATFTVSDCEAQNTQCEAAIPNGAEAASAAGAAVSSSLPSSSASLNLSLSPSPSSSSLTTSSSTLQPTISPLPPPPPPAPPAPVVASTTTSATLQLVSQNAQFNFFCET